MSAPAIPLPRTDLPDYAAFEADLAAEHGRAARTARSYAAHARFYIDWLTTNHPGVTVLDATAEHLRGYLRHLYATGHSTSHRRLAIFAARWLYTWLCRDLDDIDRVNPAKRVKVPKQDDPTTE